MSQEKLKTFYDRHWRLVWTAVLVGPPALIALGILGWPEVFWDNFVWRYLWGPIVADAVGRPVEGIAEGYNLVSTVVYAMVLAVAVVGIWRAFSHLGIRLDVAFMLAMVPWVLLGSVLRSLEDAGLFARHGVLVYLFISPLIYLLIGLLVFGLVVSGHYIQREAGLHGPRRGFMWAAYVLLVLNVPPAVVNVMAPEQMAAHAPLWLLPVLSVAGLAVLWWWPRRTRPLEMTTLVTLWGSVLLASSLFYVGLWAAGSFWGDPVPPPDLAPAQLLVIPAIALLCTGLTFVVFRRLRGRWADSRAFVAPVPLLLFAAHFLDGTATWVGIDLFGYSEKHVLPSFLIEVFGTAVVMLPLKFLVITLVVYIMDVAFREDLEESPNLGWLIKVAIMVLGLAPGMRDMLRIVMDT